MNLTLKHVVVAIILILGFAASATAGSLEDADAALKRRDYQTAVRLIRPLAEQGNAHAQYNLGVLYDNGLG
ncbi:MAG: sel1 repeat family protein, partial [Pseudolabrys sp.]